MGHIYWYREIPQPTSLTERSLTWERQRQSPVTIEALKYSAPTAQFANSQLATPASTATVNSVAASSTHIVYMTVQAGAYLDSQGQMALSFTYNSAAVQSIAIAGLSTKQCVRSIDAIRNGTEHTITFLMSPAQAYQYSTGTGQSIGAYRYQCRLRQHRRE